MKTIIKSLFFLLLISNQYLVSKNIEFYDIIILQNSQTGRFLGIEIGIGGKTTVKTFDKFNPNCKWKIQNAESLENRISRINFEFYNKSHSNTYKNNISDKKSTIGLMNKAPRINALAPKYLFMNNANELIITRESKMYQKPWSFEIIEKHNPRETENHVSDGDLIKIKCKNKELGIQCELPTLLDEQILIKQKHLDPNRLWIVHKDHRQFNYQYWE